MAEWGDIGGGVSQRLADQVNDLEKLQELLLEFVASNHSEIEFVEIPRWQDAIRKLCVSQCGQDVDGSGCDSGDPLDLTLTEIQLAFNAIKERTFTDEQKQKILAITAENEGLKRQLRELQAFYDVLSANSSSYAKRLDSVKAICDAYFEKRLAHENIVVLQISEAIKP